MHCQSLACQNEQALSARSLQTSLYACFYGLHIAAADMLASPASDIMQEQSEAFCTIVNIANVVRDLKRSTCVVSI